MAGVERGWSAAELSALSARPGTRLLAEGVPVAGFLLLSEVAGEAEVLTVAVAPEARRRGIARLLLDRAVAMLPPGTTLFLEVAEDNAPARALYAATGFAEAGRRRRYYARTGGAVDALVLRRSL